jgi:hypothetical protein
MIVLSKVDYYMKLNKYKKIPLSSIEIIKPEEIHLERFRLIQFKYTGCFRMIRQMQ